MLDRGESKQLLFYKNKINDQSFNYQMVSSLGFTGKEQKLMTTKWRWSLLNFKKN